MNFDYKSRGIDKFGRINPKIITLKSGEIRIGHYLVLRGDGKDVLIDFRLIESIEDWNLNKIESGTSIITLKESDIEKVEDFRLRNSESELTDNDSAEKKYQQKNLEEIYSSASLAPIFKKNRKHCSGKFTDFIPYISYGDIMNYKYIIRGTENFNDKSDTNPVIVEYKSIEELVNDGWRLD